MKKLMYTLIASIMSIHAFAQIHTTDTALFDSLVTTYPKPGVQHLLGVNTDSSVFLSKDITPEDCIETGFKVFILNAEEDEIIGATVQVMDGERQVTGGVTDFTGFLYLPNIEAGTYTIVISHVSVGKTQYLVRIPESEVFRLKVELRGITCCCYTVMEEPIIQDPFVTSYTSDQVLRTP